MIAFTRSALWISAAALFGTALTVSPAEPGRPPQQTPAQNPPAAQALRRASAAGAASRHADRSGSGAAALCQQRSPRTMPPATTSSGTWTQAAVDKRYAEASRGVMDFRR